MTLDKLNLGCGTNLFPGFVNVDIGNFHPESENFVRHDLEKTPLPFKNDTFTEIEAHQIMEHLHNFPKLMNECHRILKPGGTLTVSVPLYPHKECFQDPTHVRYFTRETWHYFIPGVLGDYGKSYDYKLFSECKMGTHPEADWNLFVRLKK